MKLILFWSWLGGLLSQMITIRNCYVYVMAIPKILCEKLTRVIVLRHEPS